MLYKSRAPNEREALSLSLARAIYGVSYASGEGENRGENKERGDWGNKYGGGERNRGKVLRGGWRLSRSGGEKERVVLWNWICLISAESEGALN